MQVNCCPAKFDSYMSNQYVPLEKVQLRRAASEFIKKFLLENQQFVIKHCRSFYIKAFLEIQKRYDLTDPFFDIVRLAFQSSQCKKKTPRLFKNLFRQYIPIQKNSWIVAMLTESGGVTPIWNRSCCVLTPKMRLEFLTPKRIGTEFYLQISTEAQISQSKHFYIDFLFSMPFSNVIVEL